MVENGESSLGERLSSSRGGLPSATVAEIGSDVASDLAALHGRGLLHGEISPQTVTVDARGRATLREPSTGDGGAPRSAGSIRYWSPEELDGAAPTEAGDVYSLGATLLAAALGRPADLSERLGALQPVVAGLTEPLRSVVQRCMAFDPEDRPPASEVAIALAPSPSAASVSWAAPSASAPVTGPPPPVSRTPDVPGRRAPAQRTARAPAATTTSLPASFDDTIPSGQPWYTRPAFFVVLLLVVLGAGAYGWVALGSDDDEDAAPLRTEDTAGRDTGPETTATPLPTTTLAPVTTPPPTVPPTTLAETTTVATTVVETTPPPTVPETVPAVNPFGDLVGAPVTAATGPASAYVLSLQAGGDPAAVAVPHSPAYYYALWARMLGLGRADVAPVATADGYEVTLANGVVTVTALDGPTGPIERIALSAAGAALDVGAAIQPSGACVPGPDPCAAGFADPAYIVAADAPTGARLVSLATVRADPARVTLLMYVDLPNADIAVAGADFADGPVAVDPVLDLLAVSYTPAPPPGTVLTLLVQFTDGRTAAFAVPVV